ncbi:hypothetical protein ACFU96_47880 [Streptomyces sp. NPDC057620]|uniref:hypothetical protein n=1 Tax=Streptomyces sp. NPDC057620 TaxID=3346185 RepID=UPI00367814B3
MSTTESVRLTYALDAYCPGCHGFGSTLLPRTMRRMRHAAHGEGRLGGVVVTAASPTAALDQHPPGHSVPPTFSLPPHPLFRKEN